MGKTHGKSYWGRFTGNVTLLHNLHGKVLGNGKGSQEMPTERSTGKVRWPKIHRKSSWASFIGNVHGKVHEKTSQERSIGKVHRERSWKGFARGKVHETDFHDLTTRRKGPGNIHEKGLPGRSKTCVGRLFHNR